VLNRPWQSDERVEGVEAAKKKKGKRVKDQFAYPLDRPTEFLGEE
jgi:hypothetical protein